MAALVILGIISALVVVLIAIEHWRMKRLAADRGEANIYEFANSFDCREIDTKIIREVWNEIQQYLGRYDGKVFPVQADDSLDDLYKLGADDLDDACLAIAKRLGIDTTHPEVNPYWKKVTSVRRLVLFLHYQQRQRVI